MSTGEVRKIWPVILKKVLPIAMLGILCGGALSQNNQTPDQNAFDRIGEQVANQQAAPGFSFLVWSHGSVVFAKGYGLAAVASKIPVTPDTPFAVGSISKQFTAAAILLLAQQNKLSLDDKLAKYLPGMPNADQSTLRMLLNQDSGLHNFPNTREHNWPTSGTIPPEKLIAILKTDQPDFAPGEKWEYSNTNYAVLAYVVSRLSGISYPDFLTRNIFTPLGMSSSGSGFASQANTATPYEGSPGNFRPAEPRISLDLFYGAGSVVSTAQDLARWDAALIRGKLLNADSMHALWTNGTLSNGEPTHYAMGFIATFIGSHREVWHNGYSPRAGGYCYNAIFPDDQLAVIVLSNASQDSFRGKPEQIVKKACLPSTTRVSCNRVGTPESAAQSHPSNRHEPADDHSQRAPARSSRPAKRIHRRCEINRLRPWTTDRPPQPSLSSRRVHRRGRSYPRDRGPRATIPSRRRRFPRTRTNRHRTLRQRLADRAHEVHRLLLAHRRRTLDRNAPRIVTQQCCFICCTNDNHPQSVLIANPCCSPFTLAFVVFNARKPGICRRMDPGQASWRNATPLGASRGSRRRRSGLYDPRPPAKSWPHQP
jgi:CubicO group peptidase (beta-lactamase class C family)